MTDKTKAVNLTENEIKTLIAATMSQTLNAPMEIINLDNVIERISYLNRRLKTFKEPETEIKSNNSAAGWGMENAQS